MGNENLETDPCAFGNFEMALQFYRAGMTRTTGYSSGEKNKKVTTSYLTQKPVLTG